MASEKDEQVRNMDIFEILTAARAIQKIAVNHPDMTEREFMECIGVMPKRKPSADDFNFEKPKVFECDYCLKYFYSEKQKRDHMMTHKPFNRCRACDREYNTYFLKRQHEYRYCRIRVKS